MRGARTARAQTLACSTGWLVLRLAATCGLLACDEKTDSAAENARLSMLEQQVRQLGDQLTALKAAPAPAPSAGPAFKLDCPQPWALNPPLGTALWSCHLPQATPEGIYPHCSVIEQPHVAIETKTYFEHAVSASPQPIAIKDFTSEPVSINGADAFEATFEVTPKPVALKMMGVLLPREMTTYAVTCYAPSTTFASHDKAFRRIIGTFTFN